MGNHVFVSHASEDAATAMSLVAHLETCGIRCWVAPRDIPPGAIYAEAIIEAVDQSFALLLIHSAAANSSPHVFREVERAVTKGCAVVPLRTDASPLSKALEYLIATCQWIDASPQSLASALPAVVKALRAIRQQQAGSEPIDRDANLNLSTAGSFQLRIVAGPNTGEVHVLNNERMVIGRSHTSDIYLSDQVLSRMVGAVMWDSESAVHELVDFHTREGFTVNGVSLEPGASRRLVPGDRIAVGASEMVYEALDDGVPSG